MVGLRNGMLLLLAKLARQKMADGQTASEKRFGKVSVFSVLTVDRMYTT